jgi:hypothetical protein
MFPGVQNALSALNIAQIALYGKQQICYAEDLPKYTRGSSQLLSADVFALTKLAVSG